MIPAFHPVWEHAEPQIVAFADEHAGHGNFRAWAKITSHTVRALARMQRKQVDQEVMGWVFSKLSGLSG
ncbi:hypothetical protein [Nocardia sp. NBC_00416]|uniref:hypothetical protein n=1 Tax=Nocardia sp. NBC_00416 TaxID=2975991 RepID=UPI002E2255D2